MSPDTNAYVAIPMDGMRMSSSSDAPAAARARRSSNNSKTWIVAGFIAVVLLLLGLPLWMRHFGHGQKMVSSDTMVMVVDEQPVPAVEEILDIDVVDVEKEAVVEKPKIEMYQGKPIVLKKENGKIVETYDTIEETKYVDDDEVEEIDYENEMDDENTTENDEEEDDEVEWNDDGVDMDDDAETLDDDAILIAYELDEEAFMYDNVMYDNVMYSEDEVIEDWTEESFDGEDTEESIDEEPLENVITTEDVVAVERMGGN